MSIGMKLRDVRTERGFTQERVAEELGVSRQTLSNWENGKTYPDIINLMKLSDLYRLTLDELVKGDSKMIKHLDDSTNTVKSNRRFSMITAVGFFILSLVMLVPEFFRGSDLGSGNVPDYRPSPIRISISGSFLSKLILLLVIAAIFGLVVCLIRLHRRKKAAGNVKWKAIMSKRDVVCLSALLVLLVVSVVILW